MMSLLVKVTEANSQNVHVSIFSGEIGFTRPCNGQLCFSPQEYLLFATALTIAQETMTPNYVIEFDEALWNNLNSSES